MVFTPSMGVVDTGAPDGRMYSRVNLTAPLGDTGGSQPNVTFAESTFMTVKLRGSVGAVAEQTNIIMHRVIVQFVRMSAYLLKKYKLSLHKQHSTHVQNAVHRAQV